MLLPLLLWACATPEHRLRAGLQEAGLPAELSACMAREMTPRLSVTQLLRLRDMGRVGRLDPTRTTIAEYLHAVRALRDPEIVSVTSRAALRCALR